MNSRGSKGFTFIELMIVVVVVAILAAIAMPTFDRAMRKSRRADATASLVALQQAQERWLGMHSTYTSSLASLGAPDSEYYAFSVPAASATAYTLTAVAQSAGGQSEDAEDGVSCATLTVQSNGTWSPAACF